MLDVKEDLYNGLIIDCISTKIPSEKFKVLLSLLIENSIKKRKKLLWLDLESYQFMHIAFALELGFTFHNCEPKRVTLTYQLKSDAYIPVAPTHTIGVGGIVINEKKELLMVRDRIQLNSSLYKFPGGMVEPATKLSDAVEREVYEETGISSKLIKMVSVLNSHPYRFNKSNIYIVFQLEALSTEINIIDTEEIEMALWLPLDDFFNEDKISDFQKDLVRKAQLFEGISVLESSMVLKMKKHVEVYA